MFGLQNFGRLGASGRVAALPSLIAQLFTPGTAGFCGGMSVTEAYDNGWLFADDAGTTPAALNGPVGLVLGQVGSINASQTDNAKRTTLSARVNLLTKTEDFSDAAWVLVEIDGTSNATTAPDGSATGYLAIPTTASDNHRVRFGSNAAVPSGADHSIYVKAAGYTKVGLREDEQTGALAAFDLADGSVIGTSGAAVSNPAISAVGGGWYRISAEYSGVTPQRFAVCALPPSYTSGGAPSWSGDGTSGIYIWGADFRPANEGSTLPAYQRVNTATDYDSVGFPKYLSFDGTDDCFVTPSIDLTGTDKVTVFAGVRHPVSQNGMVFETSDVAYVNAGAMWLLTDYNVAGYNYASRGGSGADVFNFSALGTLVPPASAVVTCQTVLDPVDPQGSGTISVNGAAGTPPGGPLGIGPMGNWPLHIGARDQASFFFNGDMYTLPIVVGRAVEPELILEVEAAINASMGGIY